MNGLVSWPIARMTARERGGAPIAIALAGICLFAAFIGGRLSGASEATTGLTWASLVAFSFALAGGLVADEVESGHAQLLLLRPITRAAWFGGRLCGALLLLAPVVLGVGVAEALGAELAHNQVEASLFLALPFAFVELACWVATLAAVSVLVRGWMNIALVLFAILFWAAGGWLVPFAFGANRVAVAAIIARISPYLHPHHTTDIGRALASHQTPDWEPLLWNLLWIAFSWAVGTLLLNRLELARRRT